MRTLSTLRACSDNVTGLTGSIKSFPESSCSKASRSISSKTCARPAGQDPGDVRYCDGRLNIAISTCRAPDRPSAWSRPWIIPVSTFSRTRADARRPVASRMMWTYPELLTRLPNTAAFSRLMPNPNVSIFSTANAGWYGRRDYGLQSTRTHILWMTSTTWPVAFVRRGWLQKGDFLNTRTPKGPGPCRAGSERKTRVGRGRSGPESALLYIERGSASHSIH